MNLAAYIDGLTRSAQNLPEVLLDWPALDSDLKSHYADALIELLATHEMARGIARNADERSALHQAWGHFRNVVVRHAGDLEALMSVNPLELLVPAWISADPTGADADWAQEPQLPLAA